eukprot:Skav225029  [mRNA]  locus=scaffold2061:100600:101316:+ [translate_table: standard]
MEVEILHVQQANTIVKVNTIMDIEVDTAIEEALHCRFQQFQAPKMCENKWLDWNLEDWSTWPVEKAALLKAFVDMVLGSEGQGMLADFSFVVVPQALNTWASVWTDTISKPTSFVPMTFESGTEYWVGQGENVVSSKRNSYSLWKLGDLESSIDAMKDRAIDFNPLCEERVDAMYTHLDGYGIVPLHGSGTTNTKNWLFGFEPYDGWKREMENR